MNILIVDDELGLRHTLSLILDGEGHSVRAAADAAAATALLRDAPADLILCDVRMPGTDGLAFLDAYRESGGAALVIMMSAYGDDDAALAAIKRGAYDFISKPFRADQVLLVVNKAIEREGLRRELRQLHEELAQLREPGGIVGRSPALRQALDLAAKVARHPSTVLITGESGTGKELFARLVHHGSPRAALPFVAVDCAAIPESLLESELFGHARGAFTGAAAERRGLFEEADGGTLLLDEIGELPVPLQVKLLRVLQESEIRRVGESVPRRVDVRVIAATSRDLDAEVAAGRFRADLFYRVNVVRLHLPPLRERREDIPELALAMVRRFNERLGLRVRGVAPAAMRCLMEYPWPGNVRELENVIERAMVLADTEEIGAGQLPPEVVSPSSGAHPDADDLSVKRRTEALEKALIRRALEQTGGNRTRAAKLLELSHRTLLYKLREYGLGD
ncbi:MAG: sigma-54-dependent Fis family transcriptional regulator [Gemmatimonadota bacterium]|nr:sigma-54-dependent Fis family transcriptional regulator [Gemmatimonadota bacterium]HEU4988736.1 sigma-54 dependent transcriptional regulator [Gemmatimonadaceae bacterium]